MARARGFAHGGQVVADEAHDAGGVHEGGLGLVARDELVQRLGQLLFAAENHIQLLQIGAEGQAVQLRAATERAADVPGVSRAADGPVHQVQGVGDVNIGGSSQPAVRVEVSPFALNRFGISLEDVRSAIQSANANRPKGAVTDGAGRRFQIYTSTGGIKAADYAPAGAIKGLLPALMKQHDARVKTDQDFQNLLEDIAEFRLQRTKNQISLNEATRRKERDAQEAKIKLRESRAENGSGTQRNTVVTESAADTRSALRDDGLQSGERNLSKELAAEKLRKNAKDPLLNEAVRILGDAVGLLSPAAGIAARSGIRSAPRPD